MFINKRARAVGVSRAAWRPLRPREDLPIFAKEGRGVPLRHGQASRHDRVNGHRRFQLNVRAFLVGAANGLFSPEMGRGVRSKDMSRNEPIPVVRSAHECYVTEVRNGMPEYGAPGHLRASLPAATS